MKPVDKISNRFAISSDVSDEITMYTLLNNIVFYIFHSVVVCADFLGTHMASLVLFFKTECDTPSADT